MSTVASSQARNRIAKVYRKTPAARLAVSGRALRRGMLERSGGISSALVTQLGDSNPLLDLLAMRQIAERSELRRHIPRGGRNVAAPALVPCGEVSPGDLGDGLLEILGTTRGP